MFLHDDHCLTSITHSRDIYHGFYCSSQFLLYEYPKLKSSYSKCLYLFPHLAYIINKAFWGLVCKHQTWISLHNSFIFQCCILCSTAKKAEKIWWKPTLVQWESHCHSTPNMTYDVPQHSWCLLVLKLRPDEWASVWNFAGFSPGAFFTMQDYRVNWITLMNKTRNTLQSSNMVWSKKKLFWVLHGVQ